MVPHAFFMKTDDVEYVLRCASPIVWMNGVGVWHSSFESKQSPHLEYYIKRNEWIVSAIHENGRDFLQNVWKYTRSALKTVFIAEPCNLLFLKCAYLDFLKGSEYLLHLDGEENHLLRWKQRENTAEFGHFFDSHFIILLFFCFVSVLQ